MKLIAQLCALALLHPHWLHEHWTTSRRRWRRRWHTERRWRHHWRRQ